MVQDLLTVTRPRQSIVDATMRRKSSSFNPHTLTQAAFIGMTPNENCTSPAYRPHLGVNLVYFGGGGAEPIKQRSMKIAKDRIRTRVLRC